MSSGKHMNVQMIDGLPAVISGVHDEAKTAGVFRTEFRGDFHEARNFVGRASKSMLGDIGYVAFGEDEQMNRSLRIHVFNRHNPVIPVHDFRGNISGDNLTENAICSTHSALDFARAWFDDALAR